MRARFFGQQSWVHLSKLKAFNKSPEEDGIFQYDLEKSIVSGFIKFTCRESSLKRFFLFATCILESEWTFVLRIRLYQTLHQTLIFVMICLTVKWGWNGSLYILLKHMTNYLQKFIEALETYSCLAINYALCLIVMLIGSCLVIFVKSYNISS